MNVNTQNWHNYVYAVAAAILMILVGVQAGQVPVPPTLKDALIYVPMAIAILNMFLPKAGSNPPGP